jgi:hypothetical protein
MKDIIAYFIFIFLAGFTIGAVIYKHHFQPAPVIEYVPYETTDDFALKELVFAKELLRRTQDSLNAYKCDTTISAEFFVAKYKLERIRHYTNIVDKNPTNLKFYKGWIKRVLE